MTTIGRIERPDGRWYSHPLGDGEYESVTSVLSSTRGKPWLQAWAAKKAAALLLADIDGIAAMHATQGYGPTLAYLKGAARRDREVKADIGSHVHDIVEALILDQPLPDLPDHLAGIVLDDYGDEGDDPITITPEWASRIADGFLAFTDDFDVEYEMAEATVAHPEHRYAGTLDIIAVLKALRTPHARYLIDSKTGKVVDSDVGEQLAAYRRCREVWIDLGNIERMPATHGAAVLHLRTTYSRGYKLLQQPADAAAFQRFLARRAVLAGFAEQPKPHGRPLYPALPDGTQPSPMIEDLDEAGGFNRVRRPLVAAGVERLDDLVAFTAADLLAVKGIGIKALDAIRATLADRGLTLADATASGVTVEHMAGVA